MKAIVWLIALSLLAVAGIATWWAFSSPAFWINIATAIGSLVLSVAIPALHASQATRDRVRDDTRRGVIRTITGKERER